MDSILPFFDRSVFALKRKVIVGTLLLLTITLSYAQNNNQTLVLDSNGQATLATSGLQSCFEASEDTGDSCTPSAAEGDGHAVWLSNNIFPGSSTDFVFENGAEFTKHDDGTAWIIGNVYNTNNPLDKWQVELYLANKMSWTEWSGLGRSYKDEKGLAGNHYEDWDYYIMDTSKDSKLTGLLANLGKTLIMDHMPSNYHYGFQVGNAANNKNNKFGLSGWFSYSWNGTTYHQGDFNLDLSNCGPDDIDDCLCNGKMKNFSFTYSGANGATIHAYDMDGGLIETYTNVNDGDVITVNGFDFKGRLDPKTYIQVGNGTSHSVHTSCSEQIIGNTYGPFTVISYTDGDGNFCGGNSGSSGPSGNITVSVDKDTFSCEDIGENTVTITSTDGNGSTCSEQIIVTVVDNISPEITAINDLTIDLDANGEASISTEQIASATDNCDVTLEVSDLEFDCDDLGTNTVTITATDPSGNQTTAIATVTVRDLIAPTVVTKNINVGLNSMGQVSISPEDVIKFNCYGSGGVSVPEPVPGEGSAVTFTAANCTSDNCGIASYTVSKTTFTCNDAGQNIVTVTVTDASGNVSTATAIVTVIDTTQPTVKAKNITLELDQDGNATLTPEMINNGSNDGCGTLTLSVSKSLFNCADIGVQPVALIGTDQSGNTKTATAIVTVVDNEAPVVVTQDISIDLDANGIAVIDAKDLLIICDDAVIGETGGGNTSGNGGEENTDEFVPGANHYEAQPDYQEAATCTKDNCTITGIIASQAMFDCSHIGENIVTVSVWDAYGNVTQATARVTVNDPIPPVAFAQDLVVDLDASGQISITADQVDNGSSDNCNITKSIDKTDFDCTEIGTHVVTLTVTDQAGHSAVATANVTVRDITAPTALAQPLVVTLDENGQATITSEQVDNGSNDNCDIDTITLDKYTFDCSDLGANTVTMTVTDVNGNSSTATSLVTVVDDMAPVIAPVNITVDLDANGKASITPEQVYSSITDNCGVASIEVEPVEFDCDDLGLNTVTITVTDVNGNIATATLTVTVIDTTPPVAITQDLVVDLDASGQVSITADQVDNGSSDNCNITKSIDKTDFDCTEVGTHVVTLTVTDQAGNVTTATANVTVRDNITPTALAQPLVVTLDENGQATITSDQVDNGSNDNCDIDTITLDKYTFDCSDLGANTVTMTVTDVNGNSSTATSLVTVIDDLAPVITPLDITLDLNENGLVIASPEDIYTSVTDNCGVASIEVGPLEFDCDDVGNHVVTITATDSNGNVSTATSTITIRNILSPTINVQNINLDLDENGTASINPSDLASAQDPCGTPVITLSKDTFDCSDIGPNLVTITAINGFGNISVSTATVTVRDLIDPVATAQNITLALDENGVATIDSDDINNGSSDNCGIDSITLDKTSFDCNNLGVNNVLMTVTDMQGNTSTASAIVTIVDNIAPVITANDLVVDLDANGQAVITTSQIASATDACAVTLTASPLEFDCDDLGVNTVTITATDASGNVSTATSNVTVRDVTPPVVVTKNATVTLGSLGQATINPANLIQFNCSGGGISVPEPVPGSGSSVEFTATNCTSDNCGIANYTVSKTTFSCNNLGQNIVTVTVTDGSGNSTSATAIVTVVDGTKPTVKAKNATLELDANGMATLTPAMINNGSTDNCSLTLSVSKSNFSCGDVGVQTVTLIGTDGSGNTRTANATVTIVDNLAPEVVTQNISVSLDANGQATIDPQSLLIICDDAVIEIDNGGGNNGGGDEFVPGDDHYVPQTSFQPVATCTKDNCKIVDIYADVTQFDCSNIGANTVTVTVVDAHGNSTQATAIVTVNDTTAPTVVTQDVVVDLDASGNATITADQVNNGSSDNCGIDTITLDKIDFDCNDVGVQVVTLTVTDQAGNSSAGTANVTVRDQVAPSANAQNITVTLDQNGQATITANQVNDNSSDNCGINTITVDKETFDCSNLGQNTVTLTVTDNSGNSDTATATVTVVDNASPVITPQDITVALGTDGTVTVAQQDVYTSINDNCTVTEIAVSPLEFDCSNLGQNTVTIQAADAAGNIATSTATVTVVDNTAPVIVTKNISVALDENGQATITTSDIDNGSSDNCSLTLSVDPISFSCADIGPNTVTLTGTDDSGNAASATAVVTVIDNVSPTAGAKDITVTLDQNGQATITANQVNDNSSDNCGINTITVDKETFDCSNLGQNTVTLTVTDNSGNSDTATAIVTVVDNASPVITSNDMTLELDENGQATITASQVASATDNCDVTLEVSPLSFDCDDLGPNTVSITATDASGNVSTATATVTIVDNIAPVFTVVSSLSVELDENGQAAISQNQLIQTIETDNCGELTISISNTSFDCSNVGSNTVTVTVTDQSGNSSTADVIVDVIDTTTPVFTGPGSNTSSVSNPTAPAMGFNVFIKEDVRFKSNETEGAVALGGDLTIDGNYQVSTNSKGSFEVGNVPVTLVVGGKVNYTSGNSLQVNQNGYVKIGEANGSKVWYQDQNGAYSPIRVTKNSYYNSSPRLHLQANAQQLGVNAQNNPIFESGLIDFDAAFAQFEASAQSMSQLENNAGLTNPNGYPISNTNLPNQVKINLHDGLNVLNVTGSDLNNVSVFTFNNQPSQNRILIINVDAPGNFYWNVYNTGGIGEHVSPYILYNFYNTDFLQIQGNGSVIGTLFAPSAHLNKTSHNNLAGQVIGKSMYQQSGENHWFEFDGTITSGGTQTIEDGSTVTRETAEDNCSYTVDGDEFTPTVTSSACSETQLSYVLTGATTGSGQDLSGVALNSGVTTITWTAGSGNYATTFTITVEVEDNIAPTANAQDITIALDQNGEANITASMADNGSSDHCGIQTRSLSKENFDCSNLGVNAVQLTVTDASGNSATTSFNVTVIDNSSPVISNLPANIVYQETDNDCGQAITWTAPTASDNCSVSLTSSHNPGDVFPVGTTTVTYTATDGTGNSTQASFDVTVLSTPVSITLNVTGDLTCSDDSGAAINASISGGCSPYSYSWSNGANSEDINSLSAGTYTLTVTDANGNTSSQTTTISAPDPLQVTGTVSPEFTVPNYGEQHTIYLGYGQQSVILTANASGGSGSYTYEWFPENAIACSSGNSVEVAPQVTTTYTVLVTDSNGCSTTEEFVINVVDVRCEEGPSTPGGGGEPESCACEGKMQNFTVVYNGPSGITVKAYNKKKDDIIATFYNVQSGDELTVSGFDHKGRLDSKTYLRVGDNYYEVHTSCSENIIGDEIGPFTVISYTDGEGQYCNGGTNATSPSAAASSNLASNWGGYNFNGGSRDNHNDDDDDSYGDDDDDSHGSGADDDDDGNGQDNGSDNNSSCQCEGRMQNFTFTYTGASGVSIRAYSKKFDYLIATYENVQNGDQITVQGFDKHGRLESKTHLRIGNYYYEIHTSCSEDILGESYGPITIISYTDGEGSYCELDDNDNGSGDNGDDDDNQGDDDDDNNSGGGDNDDNGSGGNNGNSVQSCEAQAADGGGHAMWLSSYSDGGDAQFFFDNNSGSFTTLENGKAKLTGIVSNRNNPNDQWRIEFYMSDQMTWSEWFAEGRNYKDEANLAGNNYQNWTYYIMDPSVDSKIVGLEDNAGVEKKLYHKPSNYYFGFQLGNAANNKNSGYGLSGWFSYKNYRGQWVQGDINIDLENCQATDGGGCSTGEIEWDGNISLCLNGQTICVAQEDVEYYLGLGASFGTCSVNQTEHNGGVAVGGPSNDTLQESTPEVTVTAFPNPTRGIANITFSINETGPVSVAVYNTKGLMMGNLFEGTAEANTQYEVTFDGSGVTEGVYLVRLRTAGYLETKKLIIKR